MVRNFGCRWLLQVALALSGICCAATTDQRGQWRAIHSCVEILETVAAVGACFCIVEIRNAMQPHLFLHHAFLALFFL
jgi:hypothetical protein